MICPIERPRGKMINYLPFLRPGGRSSMAELQPSKLATRVRFPSPAPRGSVQPGWRNGSRGRLKICCTKVRAGSSPAPGTRRDGGAVEPEGCPSGRWCNLGKVVWAQVHRGFESPPLRQLLSPDFIGRKFFFGSSKNLVE